MSESERIGWPGIASRVDRELQRQSEKWPRQRHHPDFWALIVAEEVGEVAKALCQRRIVPAQEEIVHAMACLAQLYHAMGVLDPETCEREGWR